MRRGGPAKHPAARTHCENEKIHHTDTAFQQCISPACGATYGVDQVLVACEKCGHLLDVRYDWDRLEVPPSLAWFEQKWARRSDPHCASGVWRFHDLLPFAPLEQCVTVGEGQTLLHASDGVARYAGVRPGRLHLQYEGMNPSGSFKDNGMSAAFTHARLVGATTAACASTGNTSASLALYCSVTKLMKAVIFVGSGKIAYGKLSQALDYGALTVQISGDFDDAMARVQGSHAASWASTWSTASTPSGSKGRRRSCTGCSRPSAGRCPTGSSCPAATWATPARSARPSASCKQLGLIDRVPRLAVINAAGADTLYELVEKRGLRWNAGKPDEPAVGPLLRRDGRPEAPGLDDRQRHRDQPPGEPQQVPPRAGASPTAWCAR